ncbi:hypothetical protein ACQGSH_19850 [Bacillus wiedmannii]|uniref:hypothetical protein n=1 Tax=Bacillus TaxID=1386 RepID=UPI001F093520|nr:MULTISPECIES: hypothetical protein [Bacillus]MCX3316724.1 hypothetical protein [Bacillus wiedmannii]
MLYNISKALRKGEVYIKIIQDFTEPYFKTVGEQSKAYRVIGCKDGKEKHFPITFKTLKRARIFNYKYACENPEWLNRNGDISEYNVKIGRPEYKNIWHDNVIKSVYQKYTDFDSWKLNH